MIQRGEIWWASLPDPMRPEPGYRRPVLVIQSDDFNRSRIATVIALIITSNTKLAQAPGNVFLPQKLTGLPKDSVANASHVVTLDKTVLAERAGKLPKAKLELILAGIDVILGR